MAFSERRTGAPMEKRACSSIHFARGEIPASEGTVKTKAQEALNATVN
jgi:hypothetical protein